MRVIRTEMYFDENDVAGYEGTRHLPGALDRYDKNPGFGLAFFRSDRVLTPEDVENFKVFQPIRSEDPIRPEKDQIPGVLDLFIRDADERSFLRIPTPTRIENRDIVEFLFEQEIVMEHSPPFSLSLRGVINSANTP